MRHYERKKERKKERKCKKKARNIYIKLVGWFVGFYGISTFLGHLTPNPFLCK